MRILEIPMLELLYDIDRQYMRVTVRNNRCKGRPTALAIKHWHCDPYIQFATRLTGPYINSVRGNADRVLNNNSVTLIASTCTSFPVKEGCV